MLNFEVFWTSKGEKKNFGNFFKKGGGVNQKLTDVKFFLLKASLSVKYYFET